MTLPSLPPISLTALSHAEALSCVAMLLERVQALESIIVRQQQEIAELKARPGKDSHNSSKPPSSDPMKRRTQSLRTPSGEKAGGQPGHPGFTLKKSTHIDHVVTHGLPGHCSVCGQSLHDVAATPARETRQVIDLPAIRFAVTEHRILQGQCRCGARQQGRFPAELVSPVQYGPAVKAAAVYLTQYQHLPFARCAQALQDLFGLAVAAGSVVNFVGQAARALEPAVQQIKQTLLTRPVVHFDETGLRQGTTLIWLHSASTHSLSWYGAHPRRGSCAMEAFAILPRFHGVAVHDGLKAYRQYDCLHALCNAHHLRELLYVFETTGQGWAKEMMALLCAAHHTMQATRAGGTLPPLLWQRQVHEQYHALLRQGVRENPERLRSLESGTGKGRVKQSVATNLLRRLYNYDGDVLRFTTDPNVPFDNNQAERDIRMPKLRQKVSGCFRSLAGVGAFCTIRSYLATLRKKRTPLLDALTAAFHGNVFSAVQVG